MLIDKYNNADISKFIIQAKKYPLLSRDDEIPIITRALSGDTKAKQTIIQSNLLLIVKIAYKYMKLSNNINDLIQEGVIGAIQALNKFDLSRGYRFSTYLSWYARSYMLRYIFDNSHMIKMGTTNDQKKLFYNLRKEQKRLEALGVCADNSTIAKNLQVSEKSVGEMSSRLYEDISLNTPYNDSDTEYNYVATETQPDTIIENENYQKMLQTHFKSFARKLKSDRQRTIFYKRIMTDEPETLQKLADNFLISKERVRQIEVSINNSLKKYMQAHINY
jgi:RNA polymerase sigma-32 factor